MHSFTNRSQLVEPQQSNAMFGQGFEHQARSSHPGVSLTEVKVTMAPELCMDTLGDRGRLKTAHDSEDSERSGADANHHGLRIM